MTKYETICRAIRHRESIRAVYHRMERILSPHAIGEKNGRLRVLCLQTDGESRKELRSEPENRWRDVWLNLLTRVSLHDAPWQNAQNYANKLDGRYDRVILATDSLRSRG
ncbi:MAG: hypothetical protein F4X47_16300 [Gammaproteobacteria bacterium]|nr:hypothetical protein [Gammaproteobacteria bacterium]MYC53869.1 hypothetical protein [Gammaproteobacteria bacterium]